MPKTQNKDHVKWGKMGTKDLVIWFCIGPVGGQGRWKVEPERFGWTLWHFFDGGVIVAVAVDPRRVRVS